MSKDTSGPAFPVTLPGGESYQGHLPHDGMTLRDYFAAKAMQAGATTLSGPKLADVEALFPTLAEMSYQLADAMLAARVKP